MCRNPTISGKSKETTDKAAAIPGKDRKRREANKKKSSRMIGIRNAHEVLAADGFAM